MAKVELLNDAVVRFAKGTVLEVSDQEASRLIAFKSAVRVEEKKDRSKDGKEKEIIFERGGRDA